MTQTLSAMPTDTAPEKKKIERAVAPAFTTREVAMVCARRVAEGYKQYESQFRAITRNAPLHFEECDWQSSQQDAIDRDQLYDSQVNRTLAAFEAAAGELALDPAFWQEVRQDYALLITGLHDGGLRRSFFNAVFRHCFESDSLLARCGFVPINHSELTNREVPDAHCRFACHGALTATANELLQSLQIEADWLNVHASAIQLGDQIESQWRRRMTGSLRDIEMLDTVLYRFTRAFVVGQLMGDEGAIPFALAFTNPEGGMVIDTLITGELEMSELLGRQHASFHAELDQVTDAVTYLQRLTPRLQHRELFATFGHRAE